MIGSGKISHLSKLTVPHLFYQSFFCILPRLHNYLSLSEFFIVFHNSAFSPTIPNPSHNVFLSTIPGLFYSSPYFLVFLYNFLFPTQYFIFIFSHNSTFLKVFFSLCNSHSFLQFQLISQFFLLQFSVSPTIPYASHNYMGLQKFSFLSDNSPFSPTFSVLSHFSMSPIILPFSPIIPIPSTILNPASLLPDDTGHHSSNKFIYS